MEAAAALFWAVSWGILVVVFTVVGVRNGARPEGLRKTAWFYVVASALTLPASLVLELDDRFPVLRGWTLFGAFRRTMSPPLFLIGLLLAVLARRSPFVATLVVAIALAEVFSFLWGFFARA